MNELHWKNQTALMPLIFIAMMGCQTAEENQFGPRSTALGETIRPPFEQMIQNGKQEDALIGSVYFAYDNADLAPEAKNNLDMIAREVSQRNGVVVIEGHADHHNSEEFNVRLGYERAVAVADYLQSAGVWDERIAVKSFGESRPAASNWDENDRALNRRVEVKMFAQGDGMRGEDATRAREKSLTKIKKEASTPKLGILSIQAPAGEGGN